jgi:hypothetical protein
MEKKNQPSKTINRKTAIFIGDVYLLALAYFSVCIFYSESNAIIISFPILYYLWRRFYVDIRRIKFKIVFVSILTLLMIASFSSFGRNTLSQYFIDKSNLYLSRSEIEKSVRYFQKARRIAPDHPEILFLQYKAAQSHNKGAMRVSFPYL